METIVCATRGGEACRRTQEAAIELAKERNAELIFLYVVDPSLVGPVDESLAGALREEMARLGRALLRVAQSRAKEQGVVSDAIVVNGKVKEQIKVIVEKYKASTLVIGSPVSTATHQAFSKNSIQEFADSIREKVGIQVVVVS
jgi:nucleotide-binding universal stress UspA family protein